MNSIKQKNRTSLIALFVSAVLITAAGVTLTLWSGRQADTAIREEILSQAVEISRALNPNLVKELAFEASDSSTPEYRCIRDQMIAYGKLISQRGIYSMALKNGRIVFGPETYPPGDPMASPAGTVFEQPVKEDFNIYKTAVPFVMGPVSDEYGTFLTGEAPVLDPVTGEVLMVVGVDVPAEGWKQAIQDARMVPASATVILLFIIGFGAFMIFRRNNLEVKLRRRYRYLESYLVATSGIFLALLLALNAYNYEQQVKKNLFRLQSFSPVNSLRNEFVKMEEDLSLLGDYFISSQYVNAEEFRSFTGPLIERSGALNYLWAPCVMEKDRQSFEKSQRSEGISGFNIHACNRDGYSHQLTTEKFYYPLQYIQPAMLNRFLPGFDLFSDPEYRKTILLANHNKLVMAADPEAKFFRGSMQTSILVLFPVSKNLDMHGSGHGTALAQDSGCVGVLVNIVPLMESAIRNSGVFSHEIHLELADLMKKEGPFLLGTNAADRSFTPGMTLGHGFYKQYPFYQVTPLFVFGRTLAIISHPGDEYLGNYRGGLWWILGAVMLFLTLLLVLFVRFQQNSQFLLRDKVIERTKELNKAKEKAEESDRLKSSLLLNMSHELRTPLNGILGFGELLTDQLADPEQKKMANSIMLLGKRLLVTFTSMLKLSQLEAENKKPKLEVCDLSDLTSAMIREFKEKASVKKLGIKESIDSGVLLRTDRAIYQDVLYFLIDNAIKFTDSGYIWITLNHSKTDGTWHTELKVRDSGIGIREEQLELIFKAFRQGSEGVGRSHEGPGLGLTICRRYVELLGGKLQVESTYGTGSTFSLLFESTEELKADDVVHTAGEPRPDKVISSMTGGKPVSVLIVEDNLPNADLLVQYLGKKFRADIASSGKLAIKYAYQNDYDLILMDINLGADMDGIRASKEIRGMKHYGTLPIIAVTGYSTAEEKEHILSQGLTDFLSKPFTKAQLMEVIGRWIKI